MDFLGLSTGTGLLTRMPHSTAYWKAVPSSRCTSWMVVSAVYDAVDLFQCVLGTTLHAEVVNNKQGIAAELVYDLISPGKAAVQLVQDSGKVRHTHRHFLLHQSVCNAPGKETPCRCLHHRPREAALGSLYAWSATAPHSDVLRLLLLRWLGVHFCAIILLVSAQSCSAFLHTVTAQFCAKYRVWAKPNKRFEAGFVKTDSKNCELVPTRPACGGCKHEIF